MAGVCACALWLLAAPSLAFAQGAVFVVRHAERADQSSDSLLSEAGHARAERLAALLKDAGITHVFTTHLKRTIQTAAPLAAALKLTPAELPAGETDALIARVQALTPADRVLIAGHSNTVPQIVQRLGGGAPFTIADSEYDNLFIVIPREGASPTVVRLRF